MSAEAVAVLRARGAELAVQWEALLHQAEALAADIAALERAIAILDPAQAVGVPAAPARKRRKGASSLSRLYAKGEFQRDALEDIRTACARTARTASPATPSGVKASVPPRTTCAAASRDGPVPCSAA